MAFPYSLRDLRHLVNPKRRTSWSQYAEDLVLMDVLGVTRRGPAGTYVDIGCNHPKRLSNTYALYRAGWHGIAIDLNPELCRLFGLARPRDRVVCAALGERRERRTVFRFASSELSTFDPEWAKRFVSEGQRLIGQHEVDVRTLDDVLREHGEALGGRIDLLAIDAEGADLPILKGLDWRSIRPSTIILEVPAELELPKGGAPDLLEGEGYRLRARLYNSAIWQDARAAQRPR
jgi:FkbM family methyltransferase